LFLLPVLTSVIQVRVITIGAEVPLPREAIPPVTIARRSLRMAARKTPATAGRALGMAVKKTLDMAVKRALNTVERALDTTKRALDTVGRAATIVKKVDMEVDVGRTRKPSVTTGCLEALEMKKRSLAMVGAGRSTAQVAGTTGETVMAEGTRPALLVLGYRVP
jgi:hypothetical protein